MITGKFRGKHKGNSGQCSETYSSGAMVLGGLCLDRRCRNSMLRKSRRKPYEDVWLWPVEYRNLDNIMWRKIYQTPKITHCFDSIYLNHTYFLGTSIDIEFGPCTEFISTDHDTGRVEKQGLELLGGRGKWLSMRYGFQKSCSRVKKASWLISLVHSQGKRTCLGVLEKPQ